MKKADMNAAMAAHKTVAVYEGWKPKGDYPRGAREAMIVEVGVDRRVYSEARHDIGGHIATDGVRVEYAEGPPAHSKRPIIRAARGWSREGDVVDMETNDRVVGPRDVIDIWEDYQASLIQRQNEREAAQRAKQSREARLDEVANRANEVLDIKSPGARKNYRGGHRGVGGHYDGILIPAEQLDKLVDLASVAIDTVYDGDLQRYEEEQS